MVLATSDDILWCMECQEITSLTVINLPAAFDTVDHKILLNILKAKYGVTDSALQWFDLYLRSR